MAENSAIEWTHHTFNPWIGCTKVSPACDHCYAEVLATGRLGREWGPHSDRRRTKTWGNPIKWNKRLEDSGRRERVFCASLADVFDNHRSIDPSWRDELWDVIEATPNLDWLLLTKRPQNIKKYLPSYWLEKPRDNVWIGTTVENQAEADRRIPHLLNVPVKVRFLSCEPLLGPIDLTRIPTPGNTDGIVHALIGLTWVPGAGSLDSYTTRGPFIHWVITGGESGSNYRPADPDWFRSLRDQCVNAGTPFLFKQWEGKSQQAIKARGRELDGVVHDGYPTAGEET